MASTRRIIPLLFLTLAAGLGCSSNLASVSGTVTLDGQPLKTGTVSFKSTGDGALGQGTITNGAYQVTTGTASGLKPGDYLVTVVATEIDPPDPTKPSVVPIPRLLAPARYGDATTSGLTAKIKAGKNDTVNFELKSMP
jgi:hypothetical protein